MAVGGKHSLRLTKRKAVRLCNGCSKLMQEACVFADIERAKDREIEVPACLKKRDREERAKAQMHLGSFFEDEDLEQPLARKRKRNKTHTDTDIHPQIALSITLDKTDIQILKLVKEGCYRNEILRKTDRPATTVRGRLDKLIKNHIIKKNPESIGFKRLGYVITNHWADTLVRQELCVPEQARPNPEIIQPEPVRFTKHACSFKSEILAGKIPKGDASYTPNNWTGEIFYGENYDIRVIPNKAGIGMAVIDIKVSLEAGTEDDLNTKYFELAVKGLGEWSRQYNITISRPEFYRAPHTPIEGSSGLADAILGSRGEMYLKNSGVQIDRSDKEKKGEVEFVKPKDVPMDEHTKKVKNFEYMLNQSPQDIKTLTVSLTNSVNEVKKELNDVQQWLVLQRENDLLREQNQLLKSQLQELKQDMSRQIEELREALNSSAPKRDEVKKEEKFRGYENIGYA